jgi:indolepyruvate ferredoxin oxidoreductase beta subunit
VNDDTRQWPITIAVQALGGQGGGVLVDWIVDLAEHGGYVAQSTSVAGVAQRTGATIYYIELVPRSILPPDGRMPVLAQMPVPGEVDIVIASELMEAGRAVQRGFVTPGRTTVIASSHRTFSPDEKSVPGNGVADAVTVLEAVRARARRIVHGDMQALAVSHGSVISASLFGALAGSGALPFAQEAFEETVRRAGVGVEASLRALRAAADLAHRPAQAEVPVDPMYTAPRPLPERAASPALQPLVDRVRRVFPEAAWPMLGAGLARVVEYQDVAYGTEYLDRMEQVLAWDRQSGGAAHGHELTVEAARQVAVAMAYDDIIRVADLKTRSERFERVRAEVGARAGDVVAIEEYFHPRLEELCSLLPARLGAWVESSPRLRAWLGPRLDRGRRVRSATVLGHLQLRALAQLRCRRRGTLRHRRERAHLEAWLARVEAASARDPALALEIVRCRRLIKGYSDTHARGTSRFDRMMAAADLLAGRPDAAAALARLREAALGDASGAKLRAHWSALGLPASG